MNSPLVILASGQTYDGFVVIDSLKNNTSSGGVRIASDLKIEEVKDLAREMTLKFALFRLPRGGGKAGLRLRKDLNPESRREALIAFGETIGPVVRAGLFYPGMDMNCGPEDLRAIYAGATGQIIGNPTDTSLYTAISAANALEGYADAIEPTRPLTLAIEGFGSVTQHLAGLLSPSRFRINALSTIKGAVANPDGFSTDELRRMKEQHGDGLVHQLKGARIQHEDVLTASVDILIPSARTGSITTDIAGRICARAVVPIANCPYRPGAAEALHARNVLCLPGYLCNGGGVFGSSLVDSGAREEAIVDLFHSRYRPSIRILVEGCLRKRLSPVSVVNELAMREAAARETPATRTSIVSKVQTRLTRHLPRAIRRGLIWKECGKSLDAIESDFRGVGA